jgi:hypothetical protein
MEYFIPKLPLILSSPAAFFMVNLDLAARKGAARIGPIHFPLCDAPDRPPRRRSISTLPMAVLV